MIQSQVLPNGARIMLEPVDTTATASIGFWLLHGSRDESDDERGYSHFLEHMLFKGTERRSAYAIAQEIDRVGGFLNAFTEKEITCYYCTLPQEHIALALDVLSDMVFSSTLATSEIEKEKTVVFNEIRAADDSPDEKAHEQYLGQMWHVHPLSKKITGEEDHVHAISRERLLAFYRRRYVPSNLIISVSGRFDRHSLLELIRGTLADKPAGDYVAQRFSPENSTAWEYVRDRFNQVHIYTGVAFHPQRTVEDYYTVLLFSTVFGESMSSRLFQQLRENHGYCYATYSFRTYFSDMALWTVYANTVPNLLNDLLVALNHELKQLLKRPPSPEEIEDAKSHLRGGLVLAKEDMESRMRRLVRQYLLIGSVLEFEESMQHVAAVSSAQAAERIAELIDSKRFNFLAYGSRKLKPVKDFRFDF